MNKNKLTKRRKPCSSISYTTGDIELNIGRFNQAMGTTECEEVDIGVEGAISEDVNLHEAKRYVRRYYIRPQNIFCSNKSDETKN